MNQLQIEFLTKKIVQITNHIERQMDEKKALVGGYNREVTESKKRLCAYAKAVEMDSVDPLNRIMGEFEMADFEKMGR